MINKINRRSKKFRIIGTGIERKKLYYNEIIYIYKIKEAKYVCFVTREGEYRERITMEKLLKELDDNEFVAIERGYVVNLQHISRIVGNSLYLNQDKQVSISRARIPEVKKKILKYWREQE